MAKRKKPKLRKPIRVPRESRRSRVQNATDMSQSLKQNTRFLMTGVAGFALSGAGASLSRHILRNPAEVSRGLDTFTVGQLVVQTGIFFGVSSLLEIFNAREDASAALQAGMLGRIGVSLVGLMLKGADGEAKKFFGTGSPSFLRNQAPTVPVQRPQGHKLNEQQAQKSAVSGYSIPTAPMYQDAGTFNQVGYA